ncbi:ABC transporter ATP-binding protein [Candidatus Mycoplasma mahonii]|uniref:ABC transporter ATP-binding protein n=1 Tax=Candidatus Mycoplasma mahonii TaxID=3004105 RepID=UPI0026EB9BF1|nr:ABC transporter ATP-binding protein [Candidatus Mycoplasma mahonii]WKX02780.1 ABC transporter ATP-binding protein [Candidatus Mycoplasma mahonii]
MNRIITEQFVIIYNERTTMSKTKLNKNNFKVIKGNEILKVKNISKQFGSLKVLDKVSFQMDKGEIIGLVGGNGAGKTTLSEIIAGIITPDSGTIKYIMDYKETFKEKIGMQFQQFEYPSGLTVKDIISFARNLRKLKIANQDLKELLKIFRMEPFYKRRVNNLSGGQKQKLNILISMIHDPEFLILDELSTGLDILSRDEIIKFTKKLLIQNKSSCILISHQMTEIEELCSRVIVLVDGKIAQDRKIKDIKKTRASLSDYIKDIIKTTAKYKGEVI